MTKAEIQSSLTELIPKSLDLLAPIPTDKWKLSIIPGKWSIAEQVNHLLLSAYPIVGILKQPQQFFDNLGLPPQASRSYDQLNEEYINYNDGVRIAPPAYTPNIDEVLIGNEAIEAWEKVLNKTIDRVVKLWDEERLDKAQLKHPAMGLMTIRELLYFKHFHSLHHLKAIKELAHLMVIKKI